MQESLTLQEKYISRSDVANIFGVTSKTIEEWTKKKILKSYGFPGSRRIFYKRSEIEDQLIQINNHR